MTKRPDMMLWLSDARGIYIPRDFALSFADRAKSVSGVDAETWAILEDPDHESYWDAWADVCDRAVVTDEDGVKYRVYQDGDCWLIPEGMEWSDETETFEWPQEESVEFDPPSSITDPQDDGSCDPLYGQRMDSADCGEN